MDKKSNKWMIIGGIVALLVVWKFLLAHSALLSLILIVASIYCIIFGMLNYLIMKDGVRIAIAIIITIILSAIAFVLLLLMGLGEAMSFL